MEKSRKNRIRELYDKIDNLDGSLVKAASKSERSKIKRQLLSLREEVGKLLEPEGPQGALGVYLRSLEPSQCSEKPERPLASSPEEQTASSKRKAAGYPTGSNAGEPRGTESKAAEPEPAEASTAPPRGQPSHRDECKKMDFGQIRHLIEAGLRQQKVPGSRDKPRSKEEFLTLWETLREKMGPLEVPRFTPSERLKYLYARRAQLTEKLAAARSKPSKKGLGKVRRRLRTVVVHRHAEQAREKALQRAAR